MFRNYAIHYNERYKKGAPKALRNSFRASAGFQIAGECWDSVGPKPYTLNPKP